MSSVRLHTQTQMSLPLSNCSNGDVWSNLDHSSINVVYVTDSCAVNGPAACPKLHSSPAWDQGCLEAIAKVIWNQEYHDSESR